MLGNMRIAICILVSQRHKIYSTCTFDNYAGNPSYNRINIRPYTNSVEGDDCFFNKCYPALHSTTGVPSNINGGVR
jgi:hypothetical protein